MGTTIQNPRGDRAIFEDEVLSKVLDAAIKFDGYNVSNSLAFELIVRRKQLLCEAHVGNPSQPSYEASIILWAHVTDQGEASWFPP